MGLNLTYIADYAHFDPQLFHLSLCHSFLEEVMLSVKSSADRTQGSGRPSSRR